MADFGTTDDMKQRTSLVRYDNDASRFTIKTVRRIIYENKYAVNSQAVEKILKDKSLVPTYVSCVEGAIWHQLTRIPQNAFSKLLGPLGFDLYPMLVVDLMHEVELGVWKGLFVHLLRILHAIDTTKVIELDRRLVPCKLLDHDPAEQRIISYRQVPTFGCGTIRKFSANASELKKMAARDYEDLLQASVMPLLAQYIAD